MEKKMYYHFVFGWVKLIFCSDKESATVLIDFEELKYDIGIGYKVYSRRINRSFVTLPTAELTEVKGEPTLMNMLELSMIFKPTYKRKEKDYEWLLQAIYNHVGQNRNGSGGDLSVLINQASKVYSPNFSNEQVEKLMFQICV